MNPAIGVVLALVAPRRLEKLSLEAAIEHEKELRPEWAAGLPGGELPERMKTEYREGAKRQVAILRKAILRGLRRGVYVLSAGIAGGLALKLFLGQPPKPAIYVLQILGAAFLLATTTASAGQEIETFDRCTLPEKINDALLPSLAMIGTTILVAAYVWDIGVGNG